MRLMLALAATTALVVPPAFAAETAPPALPAAPATTSAADEDLQARGVDDIVVTAQRREQNVQSVPIAISAINGDRLTEGNVLTANDISRLVPNLTGANGGGRVARPRYFLRGVGVNDPSGNVVSPIGVYYDDVYLGDTAYHAFPIFDLERVEVLRGPQGTLWGKNTIGGAINYISRRPRFKTEGYARLEGGIFGSWAVQGAAGGSVIDNLLAARISVNYEDRGGYYRNLFTGERDGETRDAAIRLQLLLTPAPDLDVLLNVHARDLKDGGSPGYRIGTGAGGANSFGYVQTYGQNPRLRDPVNLDAPTQTATLDVEYNLPISSSAAISFGGDVNWRSRIYFNAVAQQDLLQEQGGYALVNARVNLRLGKGAWSIGAYANNLTDKRYVHNNNVPRNGAYSHSPEALSGRRCRFGQFR